MIPNTAKPLLLRLFLALAFFSCFASAASIHFDASRSEWTLQSGNVQYQLGEKDGAVYLKYFGPAGLPAWAPKGTPDTNRIRYEVAGRVDGEDLWPEDLRLVSQNVAPSANGVDALELTYRHRRLPLQIKVRYSAWGETGVFTREVTLVNEGGGTLHVESLPSLALQLPEGPYDLSYLWGGWGHERQLATEELGAGSRRFVSTRGRSTNGYSAWFCLHNKNRGVRFLAQLAYSGNWQMSFTRPPSGRKLNEENLEVSLGMRPDFGGPLALRPHESFVFPAVAFTATAGDLDDGANQLHRYQRQFVIPHTPTNDPLLVQFNSWYPFQDKVTLEQMKRCADVAARLGAEVFVHDAGWFSSKDWSRELGDWTPNPEIYPHGLEELANYVRSKGMKFGIWIEIENVGVDSKLFREHPDWCLEYNGKPLRIYDRYHLNFAKPEVRAWARSVIDRLVADYGIAWLKIDYNIDIGEQFDPPGSGERGGHVLYDHLNAYYQWLDEVRRAHPALVIENCSSGGTRFDLGILAHTHTTWLSDFVDPAASVQLGYGCTVEFAPEVCNHWMVGDKDNGEVALSNPPGWWSFMLRVPMAGQFGISSRVIDWNADLIKTAAADVALYKRIRQVIAGSDVYHLTPQPGHDHPTGWSATEFVSPDQNAPDQNVPGQNVPRRSAPDQNSPRRNQIVLLAYRLGASDSTRVFKLRGVDPAATYHIAVDGIARGEFRGETLATTGLEVHLDQEWRAAVVELRP